MLLSVIIVTKDPGNDLLSTLSSLQTLDKDNIEILIKDNSSNQNIRETIKHFNYSNLRYIHKKDTGIYDAMNQALGYANGKFIYFINAGDQYIESGLLDYLQNAEENISYVYSDVVKLKPYPRLVRYSRFPNKYSMYLKRICHQSVVVKRTVFDQIGNFNQNLKKDADFVFLILLVSKYKGKKVRYPFAIYKGAGFSVQHQSSELEIEGLNSIISSLFSWPLYKILQLLSKFNSLLVLFKHQILR